MKHKKQELYLVSYGASIFVLSKQKIDYDYALQYTKAVWTAYGGMNFYFNKNDYFYTTQYIELDMEREENLEIADRILMAAGQDPISNIIKGRSYTRN